MKLDPTMNLEQFFNAVRACKGEVTFRTQENDLLNMKSHLCLFVFAANFFNDETLRGGELICENPEDEKRLSEFVL